MKDGFELIYPSLKILQESHGNLQGSKKRGTKGQGGRDGQKGSRNQVQHI